MKVLVTGAAGRLGNAVLRVLDAAGAETVGLDRVDVGASPAVASGLPFLAFGPGTDIRPGRMVIGDVSDPATVRDALKGADAVLHFAAIPAPTLDTAERVFGGNSLSTFVVLEEAAQAGIGRAVIASSQSILGLAFAGGRFKPLYLPIDADHPLQVADPYALSKQADEATGAMMARAYGMTVVTLRFPLLGGLADRLPIIAANYRAQPERGAATFWAYLEDRDAAAAVWLALTAPLDGYHMFNVAAPETLAAEPTEALIERFLPGVPRRAPIPGRTVPLDITPAAEVLGFRPAYLYDHENGTI